MNEMFEGLMRGSYDAIIDNFTEVGRQSLDDGAQVIIAGCGLVSPIFSVNRVNEVEGAPIIDPMIASLKMTEMMITLASAGMPVKSKRGLHSTPADELRLKGIKELRLG